MRSRRNHSLTHLDADGNARMVDVGAKPASARSATAEGFIRVARITLSAIAGGRTAKGDVLAAARIAGIVAAKRTGELIPLCHPLPLESVEVGFELPRVMPKAKQPVELRITATARVTAKTGVEMEALAAVSVAALTIYDMCKAIDREMLIHGIRLIEKTGGTHGDYRAGPAAATAPAIPRSPARRRK
jgi:cyclic pyranopterin phosphate synthase